VRAFGAFITERGLASVSDYYRSSAAGWRISQNATLPQA
jgi:hypothetical protein